MRLAGLALALAACGPALVVAPKDQGVLAPVQVAPQDTSTKEDVRMMPAEAYLRTYLQLLGGLSPVEAQQRARGNEGSRLFDTWNDYAAALGLPDHRNDLPRATQTNALMMATFDRLAIALCVRAAEHDLRGDLPPAQRLLFAFAGLPRPVTVAAFAPTFDVLHRTFLGYPASLAPAGRSETFFHLFESTVARHEKAGTQRGLPPVEAGWAAVCLALARHPEFNTY
jgi:hypothetical protein